MKKTKDIIRAARIYAGLTQSQLAEKIGVKQSRISEWEHGVHEPRYNTVNNVLDVCGVDYE